MKVNYPEWAALIRSQMGANPVSYLADLLGLDAPRVRCWALGFSRPTLNAIADVAQRLEVPERDVLRACGYGDHDSSAEILGARRLSKRSRLRAKWRSDHAAKTRASMQQDTGTADSLLSAIALRAYQADLAGRVCDRLRAGQPALMVLPTGAGKSATCAAGVWRALGRPKTLVIVHTRVLAAQWRRYGLATVTWQRLARWPIPADTQLMVWDEAHHTPALALRELRQRAPAGCMHVGLTATPYRGDGQPLGDLWDALESGPQTRWLQQHGFLARTQVVVGVPPDLRGVKLCGGDYLQGKLAKAMAKYQGTVFGDPIAAWKHYASGRRTVTFCVTIEHAERLASDLRDAGVVAEMVCGDHSDAERLAAFERFRSGAITVLTTVSLINEGWDLPECECVHLLRPTRSRVLWRQMVGRGLRPNGARCIILDQSGCYFAHGLVEDEEVYDLVRPLATNASEEAHAVVVVETEATACERAGVRQVPADMVEVASDEPMPKQSIEKRPTRIHVNRTMYGTWYVRCSKAHLGSFSTESEARAWADHNEARRSAGMPLESVLKNPRRAEPERWVAIDVASGTWRVQRKVNGAPVYLGRFPTLAAATAWAQHNRRLMAAGKPLERHSLRHGTMAVAL